MRIKSIRLINFKRFTDLTIADIPPSARLVVVVGPNGSGKSSLFDALLQWSQRSTGMGYNSDELYYRKLADEPFAWHLATTVEFHGGESPRKDGFYIRTAYRNDPDFQVGSFSRLPVPSEQARFYRTIDNDQAVSENYQRLVYETMAGVYDRANDKKPVEILREELIGSVRESMQRVFGDLSLDSITDPLGQGTFRFTKGTAHSYHYKNLSGGEKAAFDLLLDMLMKRRYFTDAVYCIDEIDAHLHTRIQARLLLEMVRVLPDRSQLWVTTHSLGALQGALQLMTEDPTSVALIDFDGVDPDATRELRPSSLGRATWEKFLSVTLDGLSSRIAPRTMVVCEGSSVGSRRKDFDAEIYNRVLGTHAPNIVFVSGGSSGEVVATQHVARELLKRVLPGTAVVGLVDRDDRSPEEIAETEAAGTLVLTERNLESFLFADDVLDALVRKLGHPERLSEVLAVKSQALQNCVARGRAVDDLKSASGEIYVELQRLLGLRGSGNNPDAFMRDTLAPLLGPPMPTYLALKAAVVDRLP